MLQCQSSCIPKGIVHNICPRYIFQFNEKINEQVILQIFPRFVHHLFAGCPFRSSVGIVEGEKKANSLAPARPQFSPHPSLARGPAAGSLSEGNKNTHRTAVWGSFAEG